MKDKVGILFYEVGNLKSIANALSILNIDFKLIENSREKLKILKLFFLVLVPILKRKNQLKKRV